MSFLEICADHVSQLAQRRKKGKTDKDTSNAASASATPAPGSPAISAAADTPADSPRPSLSLDRENSIALKDTKAEDGDKNQTNGASDDKALSTPDKESPVPPELKRQDSESIANLQQTVSLLIAERTDLQTEVAGLKKDLASAQSDAQLLAEARDVTSRLVEEKKELEGKVAEGEAKGKEAAETKTLLDKVRQELGAAKKEVEEAVAAKEAAEDEKEELKGKEGERVAELTKNLERAQAREGVLEAEVGRLKQVSSKPRCRS